ncbi:MAG: hypothetical protein IAE87_03160 [Rhodobacteraceae bacterium]|jgi:tyrosine-protein kinase Etk/Wzc|nr:hypothetical protein [Paracoccaceae bacterium]
MGQIQTIEDLLGFLKRRAWLILAVALIGASVAAIVAKSRPDVYEASAAIQVQGPQVGDNEATSSARVLQSIEQRLTTREALLALINRHDLYADLPNLSEDQKIGLLRRVISFQGVEAIGNAQFGAPTQLSAIIITARAGEAETAARIANDLAQGILDMSSAGQMDRANDTYVFYAEEMDRLTGAITALETKIADYKNANAAALPAAANARQQELISVESDLRALDQQLVALLEEQRQLSTRSDLRATEKRRLLELDGEIAVLTEQKSALSARKDELSADIARLPEVERGLAGMERDLDQLQSSLVVVTGKVTEAETTLRLAERQQGQRFALLDRAVAPEWSTGPSGRKLFAAGVIASLLAGLALAFVLDLVFPVVRTSMQMERQVGLRPVVAIPEIDFPTAGRRRRPSGGVARMLTLPPAVLISGALTMMLMAAAALS